MKYGTFIDVSKKRKIERMNSGVGFTHLILFQVEENQEFEILPCTVKEKDRYHDEFMKTGSITIIEHYTQRVRVVQPLLFSIMENKLMYRQEKKESEYKTTYMAEWSE